MMAHFDLTENSAIADIAKLQPGDSINISTKGTREQVAAIPPGILVYLNNTPKILVKAIPRHIKSITLLTDLPDKGIYNIHSDTTVTLTSGLSIESISLLRTKKIVLHDLRYPTAEAIAKRVEITDVKIVFSPSFTIRVHFSSTDNTAARLRKLYNRLVEHFKLQIDEDDTAFNNLEESIVKLNGEHNTLAAELEKEKAQTANSAAIIRRLSKKKQP